MKKFYILEHVVVRGEKCSDQKHIGVYNTKMEAEDTIKKYKALEGFRKHTDGFYIKEFQLDEIYWKEGFNKKELVFFK